MARYITRPRTLARLRSGPLGIYLDGYAARMHERGYPRTTGVVKLRMLGHLSCWLQRRGLPLLDLDERIVTLFYAWLRRRYRSTARAGQATLRDLLDYMRSVGATRSARMVVDAPDETTLACRAFEHYLARERGLCALTTAGYSGEVERFLRWRFGSDRVCAAQLSPEDLNRFVLRQARRVTSSRAKVVVTALRAFARFLRLRGDVSKDLALSVLAVPHRRLSLLPKSITRDEVARLLAACDQSTAVGQRDYSILLTIARLGLRASEVIKLSLDDLDWDRAELLVHGKGARLERLPIPCDVGDALCTYLRRWRPSCSTRRLFVRTKAPVQGLKHSASVASIVSRSVQRAGLSPPSKGAHLLRYTLAVESLRGGGSLAEIGDLLRHRHHDTTAAYSRVDLASLRLVAPRWPEEVGP